MPRRKVRLLLLLLIATTAIVLATVPAPPADNNLSDNGWTTFKHSYNKNYTDEDEENFRRLVFIENQNMIKKHNEKYELGLVSYKLKINQFGDMLFDEYIKYMHATNKTITRFKRYPRGEIFVRPNYSFELPDFIDWRKEGAVTPVQDQGLSCGSCWAFSAIGALEGQYFKKTGILTPLSAQNLIDCTLDYGNLGCNGGSAALSFQFVVDNKGLESEANYSYEGTAKECPYNSSNDDASNELSTSFVYVGYADETDLKIAVATVGPLSAAIDGSDDTFRFYAEGVYYQRKCSDIDLDHAILIVGYGTDERNQDYWLVKNSWGTTWGEAGYLKIARNRDNHCGIAVTAIYPVV